MPRVQGMLGHCLSCIAGAAIDNLFRTSVGFTLSSIAIATTVDHDPKGAHGQFLVQSATLCFILPFILLAPTSGSLGDRLPKHWFMRAARLGEILLCLLGAWALHDRSVPLLFATIGGLGVISGVFAPVKLAVVPELVRPQRLAWANGLLVAVTMGAILLGTGLVAGADQRVLVWAHLQSLGYGKAIGIIGLCLCLLGVTGAWRVAPLRAAKPDAPMGWPWQVFAQVGQLRRTPGIGGPAWSLAGFWAVAALVQGCVLVVSDSVYGLGSAGTAGLMLILGASIISGAMVSPLLVSRPCPAGLPLVASAVTGAALTLCGLSASTHRPLWVFTGCLIVAGLAAGCWEVPVTVALQERSPDGERNRIMAAVGMLSSLAMIAGAGLGMTLSHLGPPMTMIVFGSLVVIGALASIGVHRIQVIGWFMTLASRLTWKVVVQGAESMPQHGGCVVVSNHMSYVDGALLTLHLPRPGRFLVEREFFATPVFGDLLRQAGAIPIAAGEGRRALMQAITDATALARSGSVVVIFPEGKITRSGQLDRFRAGMERIAGAAQVPVVPVLINGLWGSPTSCFPGRRRIRLRRRITIIIGAPMAPTTTAVEARERIVSLACADARERSARDRRTLAGAAIATIKRHPRGVAVSDAGGRLSCLSLGAVARSIFPDLGIARDEARVGILLPPGRGGTIVNLALALAGVTAVNLNHTAGTERVAAMCRSAGIRTVVTAKAYLQRIGEPVLPGRTVLLEDVLPRLGRFRLLGSALAMLLLPRAMLTRARSGDIAAIVFSSGSTAEPKGVELSHRQILANCSAVADGLHLDGRKDVLLCPLPLFHSFGLVPGMWLGLVLGMPIASQADPTDGAALGELAHATGATLLISTPTFVRGYLRRIRREQLATLRFAVVGAERCSASLREAFTTAFNAELLEGYGCTELGPVVSTNQPDITCPGVHEVHLRQGTVGRPLPGIEVFAVDPTSFRRLPSGSEGLLVVRSAARMHGYLGRGDLTAQVQIDDGYNTGDIGKVEGDGFVTITGRLARFAKIGGEMVPLDHVEECLQGAMGGRIEIAVAAISDPVRGERLVVLWVPAAASGSADAPAVGDAAAAADPQAALLLACEALPALWRPKSRDIHQVPAIPLLGTGKRDLGVLKRLAAELTAPGSSAAQIV